MADTDWMEQTLKTNGDNSPRFQQRYPYLVAYDGPGGGNRFLIQNGLSTIGRSKAADIVINDPKVSKIHCTITYAQPEIVIEDQDSTNGTFVDGKRIAREIITTGSHILLGDTALKVDFKDPAELAYEDDLIRKATTDPLSAIPNRAYFERRAREELAYVKRSGTPASLLMCDIDHFKQINDTYGHQAGDYVIGQIARLMYAQKRVEDILARFGGEEFVFLTRGNLTLDNARALCERLRKSIDEYDFRFNRQHMHVTISIGLCFSGGNTRKTLDQLIHDADTALYLAKNNGRNRVEVYNG